MARSGPAEARRARARICPSARCGRLRCRESDLLHAVRRNHDLGCLKLARERNLLLQDDLGEAVPLLWAASDEETSAGQQQHLLLGRERAQ